MRTPQAPGEKCRNSTVANVRYGRCWALKDTGQMLPLQRLAGKNARAFVRCPANVRREGAGVTARLEQVSVVHTLLLCADFLKIRAAKLRKSSPACREFSLAVVRLGKTDSKSLLALLTCFDRYDEGSYGQRQQRCFDRYDEGSYGRRQQRCFDRYDEGSYEQRQ